MRLALGPARWAAGFADVFPAGGEFALAAGDLGRLPLEAALDLYAYELLERVRDHAARGATRVRAPLWPLAVAAAYGISAGATRELARMLAPVDVTRAPDCDATRERAVLDARRLGLPRLDGARYAGALEDAARAARWPRRFAPPDGLQGATPERETAACVLVRDGRVLLERRPPDARVTPGVWDLPGGHLEPGEAAVEALAREMREELGLDRLRARAAYTLVAPEPPAGLVYRHHMFLAAAEGEVRAREGQRLGWFEPAEALRLDDVNPLAAYVVQELRETDLL